MISAMTLTQLNAFVLVARLGSVTAAANALGVSESAVSQALSALRLHLGDQDERVELSKRHVTLIMHASRDSCGRHSSDLGQQ